MATFEQYRAALTALNAKPALSNRLTAIGVDVAKNRLYVEKGDHWQDGKAWVGPPVPDDMKDAEQVLSGVARDFTPIPLIEEVTDRHLTGLVGREFAFSMVDKEGNESDDAPVARANNLLTTWFDEREILRLAQNYTAQLIYADKGVVRGFVPRERLDDKGFPVRKPKDAEEASRLFYVEAVTPDIAGVIVHRQSMRELGVAVLDCIDTQKEGETTIEVSKNQVELQWIDEATNKTVIQIGEAKRDFDNDGRLLIFEGSRLGGPLITEPVRRLQNTINMLTSMLPRNAKYAGHRERNFFGVAPTKDRETGEEIDPAIGAGIVNFWENQTYTDENGATKAMPATLVYGDPVDSSPIRSDKGELTRDFMRACRQLHVMMGDDATSSGISRVQAMADYYDSLFKTRPAIEAMLRWLLKTVLLVSAHLANDTAFIGQIKEMRPSVDLRLPQANLSPDEKRVLIELYQAGLASRETIQTMLGIEDVDAEMERIIAEKAAANVARFAEPAATVAQPLALVN